MGYVVPRRTALIDFHEGHQYHGASARILLDQPLELVFRVDKLQSDQENRDLEEAIRMFADNILQSWNVTDESGVPVPTTYEGLKTQPFPFVMELINQWKNHATQVDAPLVEPSANGSQSAAVPSTPSETPSDVQPS